MEAAASPDFIRNIGEFLLTPITSQNMLGLKNVSISVRNNLRLGSHYKVLTHAEVKNHPTRSRIKVYYSAYTIHGLLPMIEI